VRAIISANLLKSDKAKYHGKPVDIRDTRLIGFILRVERTTRSYWAQTGRGRRTRLGREGELTPDEARERCMRVLGNVAAGRTPLDGIESTEGPTLGEFIAEVYDPWTRARRPKWAGTYMAQLKRLFGHWYSRPLTSITVADIDQWQTRRIAEGIAPATVQRDLNYLASVLTRAMKLGHLAANPVRRIERPRIDRSPKVRYLDAAEEKRLREALSERDAEMRGARESANRWRIERKHDPLPPLPFFGDRLTPAVLLSMNTGMRRGELLALRWANVDIKGRQITIEGSTAKAGQTRHIPLNDEALDVLKRWREQAPAGERLFPIDTGFKTAWAKLLARAHITAFRWHDLRHHFASRLVQAGVPLNTVRELLGHGSMVMTIKYAHLAPDQKAEAVARLVRP
jgi:integrase